MSTSPLDYLCNPSLDLASHGGVVAQCAQDAPRYAAQAPEMRDWWVGWTLVLQRAATELQLAQQEGVDDARYRFLETLDTLAQAASASCAVACRGAAPAQQPHWSALWRHHLTAYQALRACRQALSWSAGSDQVTGTVPTLTLNDTAQRALGLLQRDPLTAQWGAIECADQLNTLARGLQWRID